LTEETKFKLGLSNQFHDKMESKQKIDASDSILPKHGLETKLKKDSSETSVGWFIDK